MILSLYCVSACDLWHLAKCNKFKDKFLTKVIAPFRCLSFLSSDLFRVEKQNKSNKSNNIDVIIYIRFGNLQIITIFNFRIF